MKFSRLLFLNYKTVKLKTMHYLAIFLILFLNLSALSQTVDQIKADRNTYLWGEGSAYTLKQADQEALSMLINQISTHVESKFTLLQDEVKEKGKSSFKEVFQGVVNTYSSATLRNTERIVINHEPNARVLRYIRRDQLHKIFEERKRKILDFAASADEFHSKAQIADALKYYYWALLLLRSHPESSAIEYKEKLMLAYLPQKINEILGNLSFSVIDIKDEPEYRMVTLNINHAGRIVVNLEFSFWDGRDWSQSVMAKDGVGFIEFSGPLATQRTETQIKVEYICESEARIDRELEEVMKQLTPVVYKSAYIPIKLEKVQSIAQSQPVTPGSSIITSEMKGEKTAQKVSRTFESIKFSTISNPQNYSEKVNKAIHAVISKQPETARPLFTPEGYETYTKLLAYGNARLISNPGITALKHNNGVICRGPKMSFSFANNTRKFVEDVVFYFNNEDKIAAIAFGLTENSLQSIASNPSWSEAEKFTLITFMEHYKTAYALKRLDYISSIFSDDALIIVGSLVKASTSTDNPFANNTIVKYNRYSKEQYLKNLRHAFAGNEFINIQFEESTLLKSAVGNLFGIQIKQNYFSSNYADQGYLFLLLDVSNPETPIIHVRTWQPEKNPDGSIYGLEDFY